VSRLEQMLDRRGHSQRELADQFRGPWFDSRTAAAYVGCKSIAGWYSWRRRHAIVLRGRLVAKADEGAAAAPDGRGESRKSPGSVGDGPSRLEPSAALNTPRCPREPIARPTERAHGHRGAGEIGS
jgi:hypothetical protein